MSMSDAVTLGDAVDTYKMTVKNEPDRGNWPGWCVAVSNSLAANEWIGGNRFPAFAEKVYEVMKAEQTISMADSR